MRGTNHTAGKHLLLAFFLGAAFSAGFTCVLVKDSDQRQYIQSLEEKIASLQSSLTAREQNAQHTPSFAFHQNSPIKSANTHNNESESQQADDNNSITNTTPGSIQILKDLESSSVDDPRPYSEKLLELLSGNPTKEKIAIASRFIFNKARYPQDVPDDALQSIYSSQSDPDLRRIIAQVLSQRGNNILLNDQIAEAALGLKSEQPGNRQQALNQLAKTHNTKAVDAIAPLLQDPDTNVRLEALFALRDTGNQRHLNLAENLVNDPDPSVSSLASEVVSALKNLSSSARTSYSRSDIEAELPPIANP